MEDKQCKKVVNKGYIKLLAIDVGHLESTVADEKNTNSQDDIDNFKAKHSNCPWIKCFVFHILDDCQIMFSDYQKIRKNIHMFDYMRDLLKNRNANVLESEGEITRVFIEDESSDK